MAGIGQDAAPVSVPEGPLVSPSVLPDQNAAVQNMIDAFHKGFITSQDIVDRIGDRGQAQKKALLESLGEYVSPDAINSRMAAYKASGAQSALATQAAQAQSAAGLPQATAGLAATQTAAAQAATVGGAAGLQAFQSYAPWYGESPDDYKTSTGAPDFAAMTSRGNKMNAEMALSQNWISQLTPATDRTVKDAAGGEYTQKLNKFGVNVTPPDPNSGYPGSPAYWAYVKQLDKVLPEFHPMRGQFLMTPTGGDDTVPGHPAGTVSPHTPAPVQGAPTIYGTGVTGGEPAQISAARAQLVNSGMEPVAVNQLTPAQVQSLVTPAAPSLPGIPPTAPVIQPAASTPTAAGLIQPGVPPASALGVPTVAAKGSYQTPSDIKTQLVSDPVYKTFAEQQKYAENFKTVADAIESSPAPNKKVQINNDIGLAESIIKLYDPQAALREFKWSKLEEAQPWLEKIGALKSLVLREGAFTPESRQRLIKMGDDIINGMESSVKGRLQQADSIARASAQTAGQDPQTWSNQTLTSNEKRILAGQPFRESGASAATGAMPKGVPPGSVPMNIPGRGTVWKSPTGQFFQ